MLTPAALHTAGTVASWPSENITLPVEVPKLAPEIVTSVPGRPSSGLTPVMTGCTTQLLATQTPLAQAPASVQEPPEHAPQDPPQSKPVSSPSKVPLKQ